MIVYQSGTLFFPMKADAIAHARNEGRRVDSVCKLVIDDREQLAIALNKVSMAVQSVVPPVEAQAAAIATHSVGEDEWVPSFIRADWERRRKARTT